VTASFVIAWFFHLFILLFYISTWRIKGIEKMRHNHHDTKLALCLVLTFGGMFSFLGALNSMDYLLQNVVLINLVNIFYYCEHHTETYNVFLVSVALE